MFSFENLKVYQRSVELLAVAARIIAGMPRGSGFLVDQRKRASLSIAATIAEGAGRPGDADERRHFGIARGSAMESVVLLDACRIYGYADGTLLTEGRGLLHEIVRMLTVMSRSPQSKSKSKSK